MNKKIFKNDLRMQFEIDETAYSVFVNIEGRVNDELYNQLYDYMLGFDKEMQLVIADNLLDAVIYGWEHYTYIDHVDDKLKSFYLLIDKELVRI